MSDEEAAYGAAIHWASDGAWYRREGTGWKGLAPRADTGALEEVASKDGAWRPWTDLLDATAAPQFRWFVGARTNATFTAVDHGAMLAPSAVAFEHVSPEDEVRTLTRRELLVAVCGACRALRGGGGEDRGLDRVFFHMRVGLEHVVYMLACARLAFPYTCSALDATEGALAHRFADFAPTLALVTPDGEVASGPGARSATRLRALLLPMMIEGEGGPATVVERGRRRVSEVAFGAAASLAAAVSFQYVAPVAVSDGHPLCVVYTSGSTGKPKGVVHTHTGYVACIQRSTAYCFGAGAEDSFLTVATFAWITGQSYMLLAPLLAGSRSILMEGSPVGHDGVRWARIARDRKATILKMASAFARHVMVDPERAQAVVTLDLPRTLRLGTFCAEPVSEDVLDWARLVLSHKFFNSYWATEHGSIVLTRRDTPAYYDSAGTTCYPVPWVTAALLAAPPPAAAAASSAEEGAPTLRGIVLTTPYAGLARTVWSAEGFDEGTAPGDVEAWRGDADRYKRAYYPAEGAEVDDGGLTNTLGFVQGDSAMRRPDGGFTFHGRSDEVLNVSGVRVGVEELEKCAYGAGGSLQTLAVVGAPSRVEGEVPVAFVVSKTQGAPALLDLFRRQARVQVGPHAEPRAVLLVSDIPLTVTGKPCRTLLRAAVRGDPAIDDAVATRSIKNVAAYRECCAAATTWRALRADLTLHAARLWRNAAFNGHNVLGSPLLPATGWLTLLAAAYTEALLQGQHPPKDAGAAAGAAAGGESSPVRLDSVAFARQARDANADYVAVCVEASATHARVAVRAAKQQEEDDDGSSSSQGDFVRCTVVTGRGLDDGGARPTDAFLSAAAWAEAEVLDDFGPVAHHRRCRAIGLSYGGLFLCVDRVAWSLDFKLRVAVTSDSWPAVLDAGLQAVCALEAVGRGTAFLPQSVDRVQFFVGANNNNAVAGGGGGGTFIVVAEVTSRRDAQIVADLAWYRVPGDDSSKVDDDAVFFGSYEGAAPVATMRGFAFARAGTDRRPRREPTASAPAASDPASSSSATSSSVAALLVPQIAAVASEVTGSMVDVSKTLYENGLHSLRAVELLGKLNATLGVELRPKDFAGADDLPGLAAVFARAVAARSKEEMPPARAKFAHVDVAAVQRIIDARLSGAEAETGSPRKPAHREAFRAIVYMARRGFVKYARIQYRDGLFNFLLDPPKRVDLAAVVRVPGTRVLFDQTDYNRHFTVREIVRDSERGFYNLVHASGLAHLEHYYRVMFFASRIQGRFDLELLQGEPYEMRCSIGAITGPLLDVNIDFVNQDGDSCFLVTWRLMLVVDAPNKLMYDFERGGVFGSETPTQVRPTATPTKRASQKAAALPKKMDGAPGLEVKLAVTYRTWFGLFVLISYIARYLALHAVAFSDVVSSSLVAARDSFSTAELGVFIAAFAIFVGVEFGLWSSETPIQGLLPHG